MTARRQRIIFVLLGLAGLALASTLILSALGNNLSYFSSQGFILLFQPPGLQNHTGSRHAECTPDIQCIAAHSEPIQHHLISESNQTIPGQNRIHQLP